MPHTQTTNRNVAFFSASLLAVLLCLTVIQEDLLTAHNVLTFITLLGNDYNPEPPSLMNAGYMFSLHTLAKLTIKVLLYLSLWLLVPGDQVATHFTIL